MSFFSGRSSSRPEFFNFLTLNLQCDDIKEVFHNDETIQHSKIVFSRTYGYFVMFYSKGFFFFNNFISLLNDEEYKEELSYSHIKLDSDVLKFSLSSDERLMAVQTIENELFVIPTLDSSFEDKNMYRRYTDVLKYEWSPNEHSTIVYFTKYEIYAIHFDNHLNETTSSFTKPIKTVDFSFVFINGIIITIDTDNSLDLYDFNDGKHIRNVHKINDYVSKPIMMKQISKYLYVILLKKEDERNGSYVYIYNLQEGSYSHINENVNDKKNYDFFMDTSSNIHENIIMMVNNKASVLRRVMNGSTWMPIDIQEYNMNSTAGVQGISKCNDKVICVLNKDMNVKFYFRIYNEREKCIIKKEIEVADEVVEENEEKLYSDELLKVIEKIKGKKIMKIGINHSIEKGDDEEFLQTTPIIENEPIEDNNKPSSSIPLDYDQFGGLINKLKQLDLSRDEINMHIKVFLCYIDKESLKDIDQFKFIYTGSEWLSPREMVYIPIEEKYMNPPYSFYFDLLKPYNLHSYEGYRCLNHIIKTKHILDNNNHQPLNKSIDWPSIIKKTLEWLSQQNPFDYKDFIIELYDAMSKYPYRWGDFPVLLEDGHSFKDFNDPTLVLKSSGISITNFSYPYLGVNDRFFHFFKSLGLEEINRRCKKYKWNVNDLKDMTLELLPPKEEIDKFEEALSYYGLSLDKEFKVFSSNDLYCTFIYEIEPGDYEDGDKQTFSYFLFPKGSKDINVESEVPYIIYTPLFERNIHKLLAQKLLGSYNNSLTKLIELYLKKKISMNDCIETIYNECDYIKNLDRIKHTIHTKMNNSFDDYSPSIVRHYSLDCTIGPLVMQKSKSSTPVGGHTFTFPSTTFCNSGNGIFNASTKKKSKQPMGSSKKARRNSITSPYYGKTIFEMKIPTSKHSFIKRKSQPPNTKDKVEEKALKVEV